ncbi:MAG: DUF885 family protein [Bacilli bacterium]
MKKIFSIGITVIMLFVIVGCTPTVEEPIQPESIVITGDNFIEVGETITMIAVVEPTGVSQAVVWSTSDKKIASITSEGLVTGIKIGTVTIRATALDNELVYDEITLEVSLVKISGSRNLKLGELLQYTITPTLVTLSSDATWSSSNETIATVDQDGWVQSIAKGEAVITATLISDPSITCSYQIRVTNPDLADFDVLLDQLFLDMLGTDPMNINFTLYHPETYGLEDCVVEAYTFSEEDEAEYFQELKDMKASIEAFPDEDLSEEQVLDKVVLLDYLDHQLGYEGFYYYGTNLGSYLGYQAQLPIILAEYRFDDLTDIENYFDYIEVTEQTFSEIIKFEKEKAVLGMGLTDVIIDRVIEQCDSFISAEECYLIPVFNSKIDLLSFLTEIEKADLKAQNQTLVTTDFIDAYTMLKTELLGMKGQNTGTGALANYSQGAAYYEVLFQDKVGTNMNIIRAKSFLEGVLNEQMSAYQKNYDDYSRYMTYTDLMGSMKMEDLIPFFLTEMETDFPSLGFTPSYEIKEIHESLKDYSSPAMYFQSPLDGNEGESIYINPNNFSSLDNYTYQTIAHEGCPGHLYQHVYLKNTDLPLVRKNISITGYAEGWTTYIENYILTFNSYSNNATALQAFEFNDSISYVILGLADIGINYEGWTIEELGDYLDDYFMLTSEELTDIYYDMTEIPTNYLQYYFSYYQMKDLKAEFKNKMGNEYSDYQFHLVFLETGPTSFNILKEQYQQYAADYGAE